MPAIINPMDLSGRSVLVTGASSGIGRATAILLSQLGARVILVARRQVQLEETMSQMVGTGHRVEVFDLFQIEAIADWLPSLVTPEQRLDGLVHSAGLQHIRTIRELDNDAVSEMMALNFNAAFSLARAFRHKKVRAEHSSIVFVSSVSGLKGQAGNTVYAASKGALIAVTRAMAAELVRDQVRVNCVAPGLVHTEIVDRMLETLSQEQYQRIVDKHLLGVGTAQDVAHAIAFLLADTGRWITGSTLVVDGGYTAQ